MGKGDRKTRRGKIAMGTFGNTRPRKPKTNTTTTKASSEKSKKSATKA
ncbi:MULTISPECIES: 30S ribosomal protein THX [Roseivirga]|jgi:30S ribosomal protein S31|nr:MULTISPECIES: 30S ribosomal protein THX [Roseivirga]MEC7753276.1 30S ribosomal protein THX [Bacteroidota bacterium]|tara:strand:+ start:166 stop:309 length:144 start_codon:yes stop_codon:yes gene_type:complete